MKTITQHIRDRLEKNFTARPSMSELRRTQWSRPFEKLMRNRLTMGSFRYGLLENKGEQGYDMLGSLRARLKLYEATGNMECLVDSANLLLLEFEFPSHRKAHFNAVDGGEHCF